MDVDAESVWDSATPVQTTKFRLAAWSGEYPLWSFHIRGRGGTTNNWSEIDTLMPDGTMSNHFKSFLLQYVDIENVEPWSYYVSDPFDLVANTTDGKARLYWSIYDPRYLDHYNIYRDLNSPATTLLDSTSGDPWSAAYTDTGLTHGVTYYYRVTAVSINGSESGFSNEIAVTPGAMDISELDQLPTEFALHQNYPNPFNPVAAIRYDIPQGGVVSLIVYNILGREVVRLVDAYKEPGYHRVKWDGQGFASGIYIARLVTAEYSKSIKMVLLK